MSSSTLEKTASATATVAPLARTDYCDRCGAQAFFRVILPSGSELVFCGHHGRQYEAKLIGDGAIIRDETGRINEKPSVSANAG